ncbi:tRNA (guanine-N(7)-)-methyltransferase [bacterium]|nr:tRNA (guanine-N(7)-)-methyltransferase [bacterium]
MKEDANSVASLMLWTNPYIPKVRSRPDRILNEESARFSEERREEFFALKKRYSEVEIEVGSGSGQHLLTRAEEDPTTLYVGFELRFKRTFRTIEKAEERSLSNVFLIRGDARRAGDLFSRGEVRACYMHFPDPWSKNRWRKNRMLMQRTFVEQIVKLLQPGGTFSFRTDHLLYFREALKVLRSTEGLTVSSLTEDLYGIRCSESKDSPPPEKTPPTPSSEFEALFCSQRLPIASCLCRRLSTKDFSA